MNGRFLFLAGLTFAFEAFGAEPNRFLFVEEPLRFAYGGPTFQRTLTSDDFEVYSGRVAFDCKASFFVSFYYDRTQGVYIDANTVPVAALNCVIDRARKENIMYRWIDKPDF